MLLNSRSRTRHPNMHQSYTRGRRKNMLSIQIHPKMFYSYTRSEHKKHACQVSHPPNKCSKFLLLSLKSSVAKKRHGAMQKLFIKKKKKELRKNGQVSEIFKIMGTQMHFRQRVREKFVGGAGLSVLSLWLVPWRIQVLSELVSEISLVINF